MTAQLLTLALIAAAVGGGLGYLLARLGGGGWLFGFNLMLAAAAALFLSPRALSLLGVEVAPGGAAGFPALAVFIVLPAFAGSVVLGGVGLWRTARARRGGADA